MAMKKKAPMGSDRGLKAKANAAEKKSATKAQTKSFFYNLTPAQKKASLGKSTDLAGDVGYVGKRMVQGRTAKRSEDKGTQAKAKRNNAVSARMTAQAKKKK
jgi:hypothetical protein